MKERLIILGPPWGGKNTQTDRLAAEEDYTVLESGQIIREVCKVDPVINEVVSRGEQLHPDLSYGLMQSALFDASGEQRIAINGFPRQLVNAERLDDDETIDRAIHLRVSPQTIFDRYARTVRSGRNDNGTDVLARRTTAYFGRNTDEVLNHYAKRGILREVDGEEDQETVYNQIQEILRKLRGEE